MGGKWIQHNNFLHSHYYSSPKILTTALSSSFASISLRPSVCSAIKPLLIPSSSCLHYYFFRWWRIPDSAIPEADIIIQLSCIEFRLFDSSTSSSYFRFGSSKYFICHQKHISKFFIIAFRMNSENVCCLNGKRTVYIYRYSFNYIFIKSLKRINNFLRSSDTECGNNNFPPLDKASFNTLQAAHPSCLIYHAIFPVSWFVIRNWTFPINSGSSQYGQSGSAYITSKTQFLIFSLFLNIQNHHRTSENVTGYQKYSTVTFSAESVYAEFLL